MKRGLQLQRCQKSGKRRESVSRVPYWENHGKEASQCPFPARNELRKSTKRFLIGTSLLPLRSIWIPSRTLRSGLNTAQRVTTDSLNYRCSKGRLLRVRIFHRLGCPERHRLKKKSHEI